MAEVIVAETAGFCFGVRRAVDLVCEKIEENRNVSEKKYIFTLGEIIHNETVVEDLRKKGVQILVYREGKFYIRQKDESLEVVPDEKLRESVVIIRSHGAEKQVVKALENTGAAIADATCPFVKKIHNIVDQESSEGKKIVIIGDAEHPEIRGICSYCQSEPVVLQEEEQARNMTFQPEEKLCVVSQTTANYNKFDKLVEILSEKAYSMNSVNTICNATAERQQEARSIASQVELMIVIGGTRSSNSRKLFEICEEECENTYFIQTLDDLHLDLPKSVKSVGITAGASTPNNIIEEVQSYVRTIF